MLCPCEANHIPSSLSRSAYLGGQSAATACVVAEHLVCWGAWRSYFNFLKQHSKVVFGGKEKQLRQTYTGWTNTLS